MSKSRFGIAAASACTVILACGVEDGTWLAAKSAVLGAVTIPEGGIAPLPSVVTFVEATDGRPTRIGWDFESDGTDDLLVCDGDLGTSAPACSAHCARIFMPPGEGASHGDVDGDGFPDLIAAASGAVIVRLGTGTGTFPVERRTALSSFLPVRTAVSDLNGDAILDLVISNTSIPGVTVLFGNGDGTFGGRTDYLTNAGPQSVLVEDLNDDGSMDVAVSHSGANAISILFGDGTGQLGLKTDLASTASGINFVAGDFNGDGHTDLVHAAVTTIAVFLGNGNGPFGGRRDTGTLSNTPFALAAGDLDGDGDLDLVSANGSFNSAIVLRGNGDGWFALSTVFVGGAAGFPVALLDLDADGDLDLAHARSGGVAFALGNGLGTFTYEADVTFPGSFVALDDFDADGSVDVAHSRGVVFGSGDAQFPSEGPSFRTGGFTSYSLASGDFDADGVVDLVSASEAALSVHRGVGNGTFAPPRDLPAGFGPRDTLTVDFDLDGDLDIVASGGSSFLSLFPNSGDGSFGTRSDFPGGPEAMAVVSEDLNGDGTQDLVTVSYSAATVNVMLGDGIGGVAAPAPYSTSLNPVDVAVADFDGDGFLDLAVATAADVSLLLGNGDGTFAPKTDVAVGVNPYQIAARDLDSDGFADLVVARSSVVSVAPGNGDGTFDPPVDSSGTIARFFVDDFDGSGTLDLAGLSGQGIEVMRGLGNGTFAAPVHYAVPDTTSPSSFAPSDLDGDGRTDFAVGHSVSGSGRISIVRADPAAAPDVGVAAILASQMAFGDFDADGRSDAIVPWGNAFSVVRGSDRWGLFAAAPLGVSAGPSAQSSAAGDVDGDGDLDVAIGNNGSFSRFLGGGDGTFGSRVDTAALGTVRRIALANLNTAGALDLVYWNGSGVHVHLGIGDGTFGPRVTYPAASANWANFALADLDLDGDLDVVAGANAGASILLGNGDGTFAPFTAVTPTPSTTRDVALGDLNGDGVPDLAMTIEPNPYLVGVMLGNGDGTFGPRTTYDLGSQAGGLWGIVIADVDGDGANDVATASESAGIVSVLLGNGDGTLGSPSFVRAPTARHLAAADLTGDGRDDIVVMNSGQVIVGRSATTACATSVRRAYGDSKGAGPGPSFTWTAALRGDTTLAPFERTTEVTVTDVAPSISTVTASAPLFSEGTPSSLLARWRDPGDNDSFVVDVDWGDGSSTSTAQAVGTTAAAFSHFYPNAGTYVTSVTVRDDEGLASAPATVEQTVSDLPPVISAVETNAPVGAGSAATVWVVLQSATGDALVFDYDWDGNGSYLDAGDVVGSPSNTATFTRATQATVTVNVRVRDDDGNSASGQVVVTWSAPESNTPPVAVADSLSTPEDVGQTVALASLLANDSDDGAFSFASATQPTHGTIEVSGGNLTYTPDANYSGGDSFFYSIADSQGAVATAAVLVTVTAVNDAPFANDDLADTLEDASVSITVLDNDGDVDGTQPSVSAIVAQPANGSASVLGSSVSYLPDADFHGMDSFSYSVTDGAATAVATVLVTVSSVDDGEPTTPIVVSPLDGDLVSTATATLTIENASDPDGNALSYWFEADVDPAFGSPALQVSQLVPEGTTTTSWTTGSLPEDREVYWRARATDGTTLGEWRVSRFFVSTANDAPTAPQPLAPSGGVLLTSPSPELVVANSSDPEGAALTYAFEVRAGAADGEIVASAAGIAEGPEGRTAFTLTNALTAGTTYFWTAVASDPEGGVSPRSAAATFQVYEAPAAAGCGCDLDARASAPSPLALVVLVAAGFLRRRRTG